MRVSAVFALASATLAVAQNSSNSSRTYTAEDLGPWAGEVTDTQRRTWCRGQRNTCTELCGRQTETNDCEADTLEFECECSDGTTPELKDYKATVPTYICQFVFERCNLAHPNDLEGQQACEDAFDASCNPDNLLDSTENNSSGGSTTTTETVTTTTSTESSESTDESSGTASADASDATSDGSDGDDDSFAAPNAAPVAGAAAIAMGLLAYLV